MTPRGSVLGLLVAAAVAVGACASDVKPSFDDEDFTDLAGLDEKSDQFSERLNLIGDLGNDDPQRVEYTGEPEYAGFSFTAYMGDPIDARVTAVSDGADSFMWLLDEDFEVVAKNDDSDNQLSSRIRATVARTGTFYVVFRELYGAEATFEVTLSGASGDGEPIEELEEFNELSDGAKMRVLYPDYTTSDAWHYDLAPEFTALPLRIVDELDGETRDRVMDVYVEFRNWGFDNGADDVPFVEKVVRGGLIWAITMSNGGRSYGNWGQVIVLDAQGNDIGGFGSSD